MDFNDILQIIISPTTAAFALAAIGLNFHLASPACSTWATRASC